jgi:hypothetical protein
MNHADEDLARTLRGRADAAIPPMTVDVAVIMRGGRRRRALRGGAVLAVGALAITGAWSGAQAVHRGDGHVVQPATTATAIPDAGIDAADLHAEVDPAAGTITFPLARYDLTAEEWSTVNRARAWASKLCAEAEVGRPIAWEEPIPGTPRSDRTYGVWSLSEAQEYGYAVPPTGGTSGGPVDEGIELVVWEACRQSPTVQELSPEVEGSYAMADALGQAHDVALASEASRSAVADWTACLAEHGLEPAGGDSGYTVAGATTSRWDPESVAMAVTDVQCKTSVDFVQRMADARAAAMAPVIAQYRGNLLERLAYQRAVVARAEAYLAAHPEIP